MRGREIVILFGLLTAGCVSQPPAPQVPALTASDYDLLFAATRDVLESRFDIYAARPELGAIVTDYKIAEPLPAIWAQDAQTCYDTLEDLGYVVRRKATAVVKRTDQGATLDLTVIRERRGYAPARVRESTSYDLYYPGRGQLNEAVNTGETVTWTRLPDDTFLQVKLLEEIRRRVAAPRTQTQAAAQP